MARLSLCLVVSMLFGVPTCLVTSTTEFPQPVPSKPFLDPNNAYATVEGFSDVPLTNMVFIDPGPDPGTFKPLTLRADVQSEDNGRLLYARAFGDYQIKDNRIIGGGDTLEPSTFENVRSISATLTANQVSELGVGCHQVTLVVTHLFDNRTLMPVYPQDTCFLVWWVLIEHDQGIKAADCPPTPHSPADAGPDAK